MVVVCVFEVGEVGGRGDAQQRRSCSSLLHVCPDAVRGEETLTRPLLSAVLGVVVLLGQETRHLRAWALAVVKALVYYFSDAFLTLFSYFSEAFLKLFLKLFVTLFSYFSDAFRKLFVSLFCWF